MDTGPSPSPEPFDEHYISALSDRAKARLDGMKQQLAELEKLRDTDYQAYADGSFAIGQDWQADDELRRVPPTVILRYWNLHPTGIADRKWLEDLESEE